MANAQLAYRESGYLEQSPQPQRAGVRAVRTGDARAAEANASLLVTAAKLAAVVIVAIAVFSFARIALTNAAVTTMIDSDTLSAQIAEARSTGVGLEMEQSVLSSKSAINSAVKRLGMVEPYAVGTIVLGPDVVATDADGALSLSGSVKNLVAQG